VGIYGLEFAGIPRKHKPNTTGPTFLRAPTRPCPLNKHRCRGTKAKDKDEALVGDSLGGGNSKILIIFNPENWGKSSFPFWRLHIFQKGLVQPPTSSACDCFGRLELIENPVLSITSFRAVSLEAKDALKEATKEAAKKRKKEMQTAEDGKTARLQADCKLWIGSESNLIELDFSDLQHHLARLKPQLLRKEKRLDMQQRRITAYWKQRMKTSMTSKYATQILLGFAKDEIDMSYQPTWREWNLAVAMT